MNADLPLRNLLQQFYDHYIGTGALIKKGKLKSPDQFRDKRMKVVCKRKFKNADLECLQGTNTEAYNKNL